MPDTRAINPLTPLSALPFPVRAKNVFACEGLVSVGELIALQPFELLRFPNLGHTTIRAISTILREHGLKLGTRPHFQTISADSVAENEIVEDGLLLQRLSIRTDSIDLSARLHNLLVNNDLVYLGDVVQVTAYDFISMPNCGRKSVSELRNILRVLDLHLGMEVGQWSRGTATTPAMQKGARQLAQDLLATSEGESPFLQDVLRDLVASKEPSARNVDIVVRQLGWGGSEPETLESVGSSLSITRERVRQIVARVRRRLAKNRPPTTLIKALELVDGSAPLSIRSYDTVLRSTGFSDQHFSPRGLLAAADTFRVATAFEVAGKFVMPLGTGRVFGDLQSFARRAISAKGCADLDELADMEVEAGGRHFDRKFVSEVFDETEGLEWLSRDDGWLWSPVGTGRNRLVNDIRKVLAASPRVSISELRSALRRDRRLQGFAPPTAILRVIASRLPFARLVGDDLHRDERETDWTSVLGEVESVLVEELDRLGPVVHRIPLLNACVSRGMNEGSFAAMSSNSIVLWRPALGFYSRVGAHIPPGTIEERQRERPETAATTLDSGWAEGGHLFVASRVTVQLLSSGNLYIPASIQKFLNGRFECAGLDGPIYTIVIKSASCYDLRKLLRHSGAEPGDMLVVWLNPSTRQGLGMVGDQELLREAPAGPPSRQSPEFDALSGDGDEGAPVGE